MTSTVHHLEDGLARFGLKSFRTGQREVIQTVIAGKDCLCIMPTGGGKSLCYQLPAVLREGVTLVISPLIALMKDQVDGLQALGVRATFINSSLVPAEQRERLQQMAAGQYDLVYVAPERLRNPRFLEAVRLAKVQLLAVDEAHCISEWGHDFRPDYARLGRFRERLGDPQTIALTATATPDVRQDVIQQLRLRTPQVFVTGFARPNLRFEVSSVSGGRDIKLRDFDYLPPFRGRAIHLLKRDCPFEQLNIDFDELERRKAAELQKLDRVIRYARTQRCRQQQILEYFGDRGSSRCQTCDCCSPNGPSTKAANRSATVATPGEGTLEAVRMALSGAARTRGRVGKQLLAKMLRGSEAAQVIKLNLHCLSTFGLLKDLSRDEVVELLDALIELGLLEQVEHEHRRPLIQITAAGRDVMCGREALSQLPIAEALARKLDRRRRAPARHASAPAAEPLPTVDSAPSAPTAPEPSVVAFAVTAEAAKPSYYWTWRLLADGYTLRDCAEIRGLNEATILGHLLRAVEEGREVLPRWFLFEDQLTLLEPLVQGENSAREPDADELLRHGLSSEHVTLFRCCLASNQTNG